MIKIDVITSDNNIWNRPYVYADIVQAIVSNSNFVLDFLGEGPDIGSLGLYNFITDRASHFEYDLSRITIITANALEQHPEINVVYNPPMPMVHQAHDYMSDIDKQTITKHFGLFVGRSNAPRLDLATYVNNRYSKQTLLSYHFNVLDDFHLSNIGLDELIQNYHCDNIAQAAEFIMTCPRHVSDVGSTLIDKSLPLNPAQQLLVKDKNSFASNYNNFFVEIVCESYFTGNTFFPTEKILRPIILKTPFIVQGSQYFLHRLKKLGFQTFDRWWDEGYAEDPAIWQLVEIKRVLDFIGLQDLDTIQQWYAEMTPILEHNKKRLLELKDVDFIGLE